MKTNLKISNYKFLFIFFLLGVTFCSAQQMLMSEDNRKNFIKSFVAHYEFNPEGRYTHEYHPFLLSKTKQSFDELEHCLKQNDFDLQGRMIIMGYEENAVPQYYTNFKRSKIDDERTHKNYVGWSLRLHNHFGFMSGFLFKDVNDLTKKHPIKNTIFHHTDPDMIPLFDNKASIFREHAFGSALPLLCKEYFKIKPLLIKEDPKLVLQELGIFWETLYNYALTVRNKQIAGTQDALFSVEYAKHLLNSTLPMSKFFTGPDITYPIEITNKQDIFVTTHAQHFVSHFVSHLQPHNDQKTVYIFGSFVDGVGKSTILGNIKNWMKYGNEIEKFEHVDNSSSQLATLFQFKDRVFIADLPAQVSHFTYKPDGYVYVDIRTQFEEQRSDEIKNFVKENKLSLKKAGKKLFDEVEKIVKEQGYSADVLNDENRPEYAFIKNCIALKKRNLCGWIPFQHNGHHYLFKSSKPLEIRFLTTLSAVKSEGLKNIESEQMLFFSGIVFPLQYQLFLDDLVQKLNKHNIKNVVFVDFLSMYPRSSRENVRINYLMQQMALLDDSFDPKCSLYKDFVSGGELLAILLNKNKVHQMHTSFLQETLLRLVLFDMVVGRQHINLEGISLKNLTQQLKHECDNLPLDLKNYTNNLLRKKFALETKHLTKLYGLSKSFVNIQQFSFEKAQAFSSLLQKFFTWNVENERINERWAPIGNIIPSSPISDAQRLQEMLKTENNNSIVKGLFSFPAEYKNELLLAPCLRSLRTCWYTAILNLLKANTVSENRFSIDKEIFPVVPLLLVSGTNGFKYIVQHPFQPIKEKIPLKEQSKYRPFKFLNHKPHAFTSINNIIYRMNWESRSTNNGLLGFDCEISKKKNDDFFWDQTVVSSIVRKYQKKHGENLVMPTSKLYKQLKKDSSWKNKQKKLKKKARKNGKYSGQSLFSGKHTRGKNLDDKFTSWHDDNDEKKIYIASEAMKPAVRIMIRLLATLEMVIKDPNANIVVRDGNKKDFKAALKLFEQIVLPKHCSLLFPDKLFDDYDTIEPYPSWDFWDNIS